MIKVIPRLPFVAEFLSRYSEFRKAKSTQNQKEMQNFDPLLIIYQILCMQCFYYLAFGTCLGFCHAMFNINVSMDSFFTSQHVNFVSTIGWIETMCLLSSALLG